MEDLKPLQGVEKPLAFTPSAIKELRRLIESEKHSGEKALRIGVKGGGCAGFSYTLDFEVPTENDEQFMVDELSVVVDPTHKIYLQGTKVDFESGLNNRGFTFTNPNAETTCGCGSSFG